MQKVNWNVHEDRIRVQLPIAKINKEARTVSGFATLDNIDQQNDEVTAEASREAFERFRGNVREMHQPIAVGKVIDFKEDEFFDASTKKMYRGIFVTVRVSKGAEDTWQKVLDETLTGFSIGGDIVEKQFVNDGGREFRRVTKYELTELSLVDNPANQLANVLSIQKVDGVLKGSGMAVEPRRESIFYCDPCDLGFSEELDKATCPACDNGAANIGWVDVDVEQAIAKAIDKYKETEEVSKRHLVTEQEEEDMTDKTVEKSEEVEETVEEVEVAETEEVAKATAVEEVETETFDAEAFTKNIEKTFADQVEAFTKTVTEQVTKAQSEFKEAIEELQKSLTALSESVETLEESGAVRKSAEKKDLEKKGTKIEKGQPGFWGNAFHDADDL